LALPDTFGSPIVVKTPSGSSNPIPIPVLDGIFVAAIEGIPVDQSLPSANVGQKIRIIGQNLAPPIRVRFPGLDKNGAPIQIDQPAEEFSPDGKAFTVTVPTGVISGSVSFVRDDLTRAVVGLLQIVPTVTTILAIQQDSPQANEIAEVIGSGFVTGGSRLIANATEVQAINVQKSGTRFYVPLIPEIQEGTPVTVRTGGGESAPVIPIFVTDEGEFNDIPELAQPIPFGMEVSGLINSLVLDRHDIDFYRVEISPKDWFIEFRLTECEAETILTVMTPTGKVLAEELVCGFDGIIDQEGRVLFSRPVVITPIEGLTSYLVRIEVPEHVEERFPLEHPGVPLEELYITYRLQVRLAPSETEPNDFIGEAEPIVNLKTGLLDP
jgi:hypothetical protein